MKENYFSSDNIDQKANEFFYYLKKFVKIDKKIPQKIDDSALLVLDMQWYFLNESSHAYIPSAEFIMKKLKFLCNEYKKRNLPIIMTYHTNNIQNAHSMGRWWKELISEDSDNSRIIPELSKFADYIIEKHQYDAFFQTNLKSILNTLNIKSIVIGGVMTHLCCETTARSAFVHGYDVFFLVDGTATYNEEFHKNTLLNLSHGFAIPITVNDLIKLL